MIITTPIILYKLLTTILPNMTSFQLRDLVDQDSDSDDEKSTTIQSKDQAIKTTNKTTNKKSNDNQPWIERYRPRRLKDVVCQEEVVKMLNKSVETGDLPSLILYGPAGVGKTSTILAAAKELFGPKLCKERVLELNASDERGINVVRDKIVRFAKTALGRSDSRYLCPDYKIIILDEADAMTGDAQSALRIPLEAYSATTRFCFICNNISAIIKPIRSRCTMFRYKPLEQTSVINTLGKITSSEKMTMSKKVLHAVSDVAGGDMRKAIMLLQNLRYVMLHKQSVEAKDVYELANSIDEQTVKKIRKVCILDKNRCVKKIVALTKKINKDCIPIDGVLVKIVDVVMSSEELDDKSKAEICMYISTTERRVQEAADEYLQLLGVFLKIKSLSVN